MEVLVPVLFVAGIGFLVVVAVAAGWRRRRELTELAAARGWRLVEKRDPAFERRFPEFDCLRTGDRRRADRTLEGEAGGLPFVGFDYHYSQTSGTGKDRRTTHHHFSGVIVETELALEPLSLRSETIFDRVSAFFGMGDIDFELAEFNRAFHVRCPDRRFAIDAIQPATMEFLLASPRFQIECGGSRVLAWRSKLFSAHEFPEALDVLHGVLERLPPSFVEERRRRA